MNHQPLLTTKPGYLTDEEWIEFQARFEVDPLHGTAYLNDIEISKSVELCYSWPRVLQFSLTSYCNITCRFCAQTDFNSRFRSPSFSPDEISVEAIATMFRDVETGYPFHVDFSGDGEPIVHPDFLGILEFSRKKFPFSVLRTCTNGLALTNALSDQLIERKLDWLNISLNAGTKRGWELTTGLPHFDRVVDQIRYLQNRKKKLKATAPVVGMTFVLTRQTLEDLPAFLDLCVDLGVHSATVHHMTINTARFGDDSIIHVKERANEVIRSVGERAKELGFFINLPALFADSAMNTGPIPDPVEFDFNAYRRDYAAAFAEAKRRLRVDAIAPDVDFASLRMMNTIAAIRCRYPWDYFLVKGDGTSRICCGGLPAESGSLLRDGFWPVWNGELRRYMRRTVNTARIDEDCYYCPLNATRDVNEAETHMRNTARAQMREPTPVG